MAFAPGFCGPKGADIKEALLFSGFGRVKGFYYGD
jgi:hypothetical protein